MLITYYFPFMDEREFGAARANVATSGFLRIGQQDRFQKNLGAIRPRPRGGFEGWIGESSVCEIRRAIRFDPPMGQRRKDQLATPVFKRMFFDGDHCGYFSLGLAVPDSIATGGGDGASFPEIAEKLSGTTISTRHCATGNGQVSLRDFSRLAGEVYFNGSSRSRKRSQISGDAQGISAATPLTVIETSAAEADVVRRWRGCRSLRTKVDIEGDVTPYFGPLKVWPNGILIVLRSADRSWDSRFLRSGLVRLYLEVFSLRRKIAILQSEAVESLDEEGWTRLGRSVNRSLRRLQGRDQANIAGMSGKAYDFLIATYAQGVMPGEIGDLETVIARLKARPNLRRMVTASLVLDAEAGNAAIEKVEIVMTKNEVGPGGIGIIGNVSASTLTTNNTATTVNYQVEVKKALAPVEEAIKAAPQNQDKALEKLKALEAEAGKGEKADDAVMGKLVDGIIGLVPGAVTAVVSAFGTPILGALAGPVTKFVIDKINGT